MPARRVFIRFAGNGSADVWAAFFRWIIARRRLVLAATSLLVVVGISYARNLQVIVDNEKLLPATHPCVQASREVTRAFGWNYTLVVAVRCTSGTLDVKALKVVKAITLALGETPHVNRNNILSIASERAKIIEGADGDLKIRPLLSADMSPEEVFSHVDETPLFRRLLLSDDHSTAFIIAEYKEAPRGYREVMTAVEAILDKFRDSELSIYTGGFVRVMAETESASDLTAIFLLLAALVIAALLYLCFGTIQSMVVPLATGLVTVAMMLGLMGALGLPVDVFNSTTPILILAVVAGHSVQILARYYEEHAARVSGGQSPAAAHHDAIVASSMHTGPVMVSAGAAASLGFYSLTVFDIKSIWVFGMMAGSAIVIGLILELLFIPSLRAALRPASKASAGVLTATIKSACVRLGNLVIAYPGWIVAIGLTIACIAVLCASQVSVNNSNKENFAKGTSVRRDDARLNQAMAGTNVLYIVLDSSRADGVKEPAFLRAVDALQSELARDPLIGKTVSVADHVKRLNQAFKGGGYQNWAVPDRADAVGQLLMLYSLGGGDADIDTFVDSEFRVANVMVSLREERTAITEALIRRIQALVFQYFGEDVSARFGGTAANAVAITEVMVHDKLINMIQVVLVVAVVAAAIFRSVVAGIMVVIPVCLAVVCNFGLMGALRIPLNIPTSLCSALVVGIGADFGIYFLSRLREYVRAGQGLQGALLSSFRTAGAASLIVAAAIAAGYATLLLSPGFNPHRWMGMLFVVALTVSVIGALTIVPALIILLRPRFVAPSGVANLSEARQP